MYKNVIIITLVVTTYCLIASAGSAVMYGLDRDATIKQLAQVNKKLTLENEELKRKQKKSRVKPKKALATNENVSKSKTKS